jgi:hydroxymethylglutaryl-CoA synthase
MVSVGIDRITYYVPSYYLDLMDLAKARGMPEHRLLRDLGQTQMAVCPPVEDVVTMGCNAAFRLQLDDAELAKIRWVLFATESSVDQSKAAGIYAHRFLKLSPQCRVLEIKQACYGATGAIQIACDYVRGHPDDTVLVIASDIAKYEIGSLAEATHGCGAAAILISANPRLLSIEQGSGYFSDDVMDFWRPNYLEHAVFSSKYSVKNYLDVLERCWEHFARVRKLTAAHIDAFCYHTPFARMAHRVHHRFVTAHGRSQSEIHSQKQMEPCLQYNQRIGNAYSASLYISLCALLDQDVDLSHQRVGLFSYGSGCVAEYFTGIIQPGYASLRISGNWDLLEARHRIEYDQYLAFYHYPVKSDGDHQATPVDLRSGRIRFQGWDRHQRLYVAHP